MKLFTKSGPVVIPGPDGEVQAEMPHCAACGRRWQLVHAERVGDGSWLFLCDDYASCSTTSRAGVSPESYAAGLRGELLAVAL